MKMKSRQTWDADFMIKKKGIVILESMNVQISNALFLLVSTRYLYFHSVKQSKTSWKDLNVGIYFVCAKLKFMVNFPLPSLQSLS